jgi:hypothetical protein
MEAEGCPDGHLSICVVHWDGMFYLHFWGSPLRVVASHIWRKVRAQIWATQGSLGTTKFSVRFLMSSYRELEFSDALKRQVCLPGDGRVAALCCFVQMLGRASEVPFPGENET